MEAYEPNMIAGTETKVPFPMYNTDEEAIESAIEATEERATQVKSECPERANCLAGSICYLLLDLESPYDPDHSRVFSYHVRCESTNCPNLAATPTEQT